MLAVLNKNKKVFPIEDRRVEDTIVIKVTEKESFDEEGNKITKRIEKKVNLTKKINESKRLLKSKTAEEKAAELEKIYTQGA